MQSVADFRICRFSQLHSAISMGQPSAPRPHCQAHTGHTLLRRWNNMHLWRLSIVLLALLAHLCSCHVSDASIDLLQDPAATPDASAPAAPAAVVPQGSTPAGSSEFSEVGLCEVCSYVLENKMQHQPYLCKGLKDPNYQQICVQVMESLMWWISNQVYWVNYGCQMNQNGAVTWVRPCPAHAICSWLQHLYLRKPYCPADPNFPKPA